MTRQTLRSSSRPTATSRLASAVAVTTDRSELPMLFEAALTKYGGNSSSMMTSGWPWSRFTQAVWPGAASGE
jgi:hypothetical protein